MGNSSSMGTDEPDKVAPGEVGYLRWTTHVASHLGDVE